jgi:hypothetical protein
MQQIIVTLVVIAAAAYVALRIYKSATSKNKKCSCGCTSCSCKQCKSSSNKVIN